MSTVIEWTHRPGTTGETWNPVTGCTKVSPGCDHCYAERVTERWQGKGSFERVVLHEDRLTKPLHWRKPRTVFVNSMSDLFHEDVPDEYIAAVFAVMSVTPHHTYQVLTKRHGRMRSLLNSHIFWTRFAAEFIVLRKVNQPVAYNADGPHLPNVWLGVSVEDQKWADIRVPALLDTPAAVRFLSCEPLLGPVDILHPYLVPGPDCACEHGGSICDTTVDWVIVGGESGLAFRPMQVDWARSLRDQCTAARVPCFVKQMGSAWAKSNGADAKGGKWELWPADLRIRQFPEVAHA